MTVYFQLTLACVLGKLLWKKKDRFTGSRHRWQILGIGNYKWQSLLTFQTMAVMKYGILLNKFQVHKMAYQNFSPFFFFLQSKILAQSWIFIFLCQLCGGSSPDLCCGVAANFLLLLLLLIFLLLFLKVFIVVKYA